MLYALVAFTAGLLPRHRDFRVAANGVDVYVQSNGVHTDLLLPWQALTTRGRQLPASDFGNPPPGATYMALGWGDRNFYLNTRSWNDLTVGKAAYALSGLDQSVLHVEPVRPPRLSADVLRVRISPTQLRLLTDYVLNLETAVDRLDLSKIPIHSIGCDFDHRHPEGENATGQSARFSVRQAALQLLEISRYFYVALPCLTAR